MFSKSSVSARMMTLFIAAVLLFGTTFFAVGTLLSHLTQNARQIEEQTLPYILIVDEMNLSRSEVQQYITDVSATHDRDGYKDAEQSALRFLSGIEKYKQLYRRNNDFQSLREIEAIEESFNHFYDSGKIMAESYINQGVEAGNLLMKGSNDMPGFDSYSESIAKQLAKFREQQIAEAHKTTASTLSNAESTMNLMIVGSLMASLLAAMIGAWVVRSILRQLGGEPAYAADIVSKIADGDLTVQVETKARDNSSMLFGISDMVDKLGTIVGEVRRSTDTINTAAKEITQGNNDLSRRTEDQASSLEQTASSMEQLTSTVKQTAESAKQANQLAMNASDIAVRGGQAVSVVVDTMSSISSSSKKIVDIISVIEDIAFQTNILALNAAVEAARAGAQGHGFAVVATEVRNLALRSATAAKEIKKLIDDSVSKVDAGSLQVDQAGATMNEIVNAVKRVTDIMAEISAASDEQSAGILQINQAIIQMEEVTQQNAALVEEAAAAAESMQEQSEVLMRAVSIFKTETKVAELREAVTKPVAKPAIANRAPDYGPAIVDPDFQTIN